MIFRDQVRRPSFRRGLRPVMMLLQPHILRHAFSEPQHTWFFLGFAVSLPISIQGLRLYLLTVYSPVMDHVGLCMRMVTTQDIVKPLILVHRTRLSDVYGKPERCRGALLFSQTPLCAYLEQCGNSRLFDRIFRRVYSHMSELFEFSSELVEEVDYLKLRVIHGDES